MGLAALGASAIAQRPQAWRPAAESELRKLIPARAPVVAERIETEFRTASGITDGQGRFLAGVVLITAGYSAEGKYSNWLVAQVSVTIGGLSLPAGQYVFGWTRNEESLAVRFYEAATGKELGTVEAKHDLTIRRVESFHIWPPADHGVVQLGRFVMPYSLGQ